MSNTSNGPAKKGSKYWMQKIVNTENLRRRLEKEIGFEKTIWVSPIENEQYKEYRLNEASIANKLGLDGAYIRSFWPAPGPQWDALGNADDGTIVLVEAKAHPGEVNSRTKATGNSLALIKETLLNTHDCLRATIPFREEIWLYKYYQAANRLAFWNKLNKKYKVALVFLNLVNDEYGKTSEQVWETHTQKLMRDLLGNANLPPGIKIIPFDVEGISL